MPAARINTQQTQVFTYSIRLHSIELHCLFGKVNWSHSACSLMFDPVGRHGKDGPKCNAQTNDRESHDGTVDQTVRGSPKVHWEVATLRVRRDRGGGG